MLRIFAGILAAIAIWLFHLAAISWWVDTTVVEPVAIEEAVGDVVASDAFIGLVAGQIEDRLESELTGIDVPRSAIEAVLAQPETQVALQRVAREATNQMLGRPANEVLVDLDLIRRQMSSDLAANGETTLASQLEAAPVVPPLVFNPETTPLPNLSAVEKWSSLAWSIPIMAAAVALVMAMILHPKPGRIVRRVGLGIVIGSAVILGFSWLWQRFVLGNLPSNEIVSLGQLLLVRLGDELTSQVRIQLAIGAVMIATGQIWLSASKA
ncbi:MAG: hypothetical protein ACC652_03775, partial [Acidimicrobiales bacterium]